MIAEVKDNKEENDYRGTNKRELNSTRIKEEIKRRVISWGSENISSGDINFKDYKSLLLT